MAVLFAHNKCNLQQSIIFHQNKSNSFLIPTDIWNRYSCRVSSLLTEPRAMNQGVCETNLVIDGVLRNFLRSTLDCYDRALSMLHAKFAHRSDKNPGEANTQVKVINKQTKKKKKE